MLREIAQQNLQLLIRYPDRHFTVGEKHSLRLGLEGDLGRLRATIRTTVLCASERSLFVRIAEGGHVKFVNVSYLKCNNIQVHNILRVAMKSLALGDPTELILSDHGRSVLDALSAQQAVNQYDLLKVVREAVKNGYLDIVRFLLSEGRALDPDHVKYVVREAAGNGWLDIVRFLLSEGGRLDQYGLDLAVAAAAGNGHLNIIQFLLPEVRKLDQYGLDLAVAAAAGNGHLNIIQFLLPEVRKLDQYGLGRAVEVAAAGGHRKVVQFLVRRGWLDQEGLNKAVEAAAAEGHLAIVQCLLSEGGRLDQYGLGRAVEAAAAGGHLAIVQYLLSGCMLSIDQRSSIVDKTFTSSCLSVRDDLIKTLLHDGPIFASVRDFMVSHSLRRRNLALADFIYSANTVPDRRARFDAGFYG